MQNWKIFSTFLLFVRWGSPDSVHFRHLNICSRWDSLRAWKEWSLNLPSGSKPLGYVEGILHDCSTAFHRTTRLRTVHLSSAEKPSERPTMAIVWPSAGPLSAVTSWRAYVRASTGQTGAPAHLSSHLVQVMVRFQRQTSNLMASVVANQFARLAGTVFWLHYEHMHTELLSN